jgi:lysyl-tRNA synthetase class 2
MHTFSLARFRHAHPRTPFRLGGEYTRADGMHLLVDPFGTILLNGPQGLFDEFQPGDLIAVEVERATEMEVYASEAELLQHAKPSAPVSEHPAKFARFVQDVRDFFIGSGFNEIPTPTLVPCPGLEPSLEPFKTTARKGSKALDLYLPTSPEIHLKKALAKGFTDIFEIKSCFRSGEYSTHHDHEFTMLEWYRAYADLELVTEDLRVLIHYLAKQGWCSPIDVKVTDFATLFKVRLGLKLTPKTTANELRQYCKNASGTDTFADLFHRILIDEIEPILAGMGPLIIKNFPPELAALAKINEQGWGDRFEFYWNGLEIANAFNEVTDAEEQKKRWEGEQKERARLKTAPLPIDAQMLEGLKKGVPPTGGIALGVERLYMACQGIQKIGDLKLFPGENLFL